VNLLIALLFAASLPLAAARWLRVAQREHYLPGAVCGFARRWWTVDSRNIALLGLGVVGLVGSLWEPWAAVVPIEVAAVGPFGLSMRGSTSPLAWTRRLRTLAGVYTALSALLVAVGALAGFAAAAMGATALAAPVVVDLALALTRPLEKRAAGRFVDRARSSLDRVSPTRVAITGSFGKTTVKGYLRHLVSGSRSVVASPASFNNTGGLSRTVNEHLTPDTEVFIAEMGAYGPGEIRDLCSWVRPDVAVLCHIGPVHLERFGTLEATVRAKAEIFETAGTAVLNVDDPLIDPLAGELADRGLTVVTCSGGGRGATTADVIVTTVASGPGAESGAGPVRPGSRSRCLVTVRGETFESSLPDDTHSDNAALAVGAAVALGVEPSTAAGRLPGLRGAPHRREFSVSPTGVTVIDDTFNSNPAGAAAAVAALASVPARRRVVATPGMVELGDRQRTENIEFGRLAATTADTVIIIGRTNRAALLEGSRSGTAEVVVVANRGEAVQWARNNLEAGDAVLYENDLPDHFP